MTESPGLHPDRHLLADFGLGRLESSEASWIEDHLSTCPTCCDTLLSLKDDTFTGLVRSLPEPPPTEETWHETDPAAAPRDDSVDSATVLVQSGDPVLPAELPRELYDHPRYRIVSLIGRGGMGDVYRAEHRLMNRPVALKLISSQLVNHPQAAERFRREVQAAAQLSHPHIVAAYDAEQAGQTHFLVMEFVDGTDLATLVQGQGPLPVDRACDAIRQAALGLQHAHERGMVHRDIKPHNLMMSPDGQVRILDFGLAGFATEAVLAELADEDSGATVAAAALHLTSAGSVMGTPDYIAPEQARDAHAADIRSDIYSLGCTLYYLLTGRPPFAEGGVMDKLESHAVAEPEPIETLNVEVPLELADVIRRMMAKTPADRFQTPAEVANALADFVDRHRTDGGGRGRGPGDGPSAATSDPMRFGQRVLGMTGVLTVIAALMAISNRGWITFQYPEWLAPWLIVGGMVSLPLGVAAIIASLQMLRRRWYGCVMVTVGLLLLPVNPVQIAMLPLTVWLLRHLRRPDIRAVFAVDGVYTLPSYSAPPAGGRRLCLALSALIGAGLLGVIIHLDTDHGDLTIEVNDPSLTVRIERDGRVMRQLESGDMRVTFLPSGHYEITVPGANDQVTITPNRVNIFRGAKKFVTIRREQAIVQDTDHVRIQGVWVAESGQRNGQPTPLAEIGMQQAIFDGDQLHIDMPGGLTGDGSVQLIETSSPKQIWIQVEGRSDGMRGIYRLDGDLLTLCMNQDRAGALPKTFAAPAGTSIDLIVMRRAASRTLQPPSNVTPFEAELARQNRTVTGNSLPVIIFERNGHAAFRFGQWLLVFEGVPCQGNPKAAGLLGIGGFNYPIRDGRGTVGKTTFGNQVSWTAEWDSQANTITVAEKYTFKLLGKGTRLEFANRAYAATNDVQTIVVGEDGSTRVQILSTSASTRLYTISDKAELVAIDVADKAFATTVVRQLGDQFKTAEGLALLDRVLYAAVNRGNEHSRLLTVHVDSGEVTEIGSLGTRQVDGLAWAEGQLLGVTSKFGGTDVQGADAGRLIAIDPATAKTRPIGGELKLDDLDSLLFDDRGRLLTTDGIDRVDQFYELDRQGVRSPKSIAPTPAITADRDVEGLAQGADGMLYAVTHPATTDDKVSYLVRIHPETFRHENLGSLGFGTYCLAADRRAQTASVDQSTAAITDHDRLQGKWVPVSVHIRGQALTMQQLARMAIAFNGDRAEFTDPDSGLTQSARFSIDPSRSPKHIDFIAPDASERMPGIYDFDGERLKLAWVDGDYARPVDFEPVQTADHMTAVCKRVHGSVPTTMTQDEPAAALVLDETQKEVIKAAESYLSVVDEGKFGSLREMVSSLARPQVTREQVSQIYQKLRDTFGKAQHRTLERVQVYDELPNLPKGRYAVVQYKTDFTRQQGLWEVLLLNVDTDEKWRVNSYQITLQPPPLPEAKADPAVEQKKLAALTAAQNWFKLVDGDKYGEAWETSAKINRDGIGKQQMVEAYNELFKPLGKLNSRELKSNEYATQMPRAPVGEYAVIQFRSQFTNERIIETVILMRESDGHWRTAGYRHAEDQSVPPRRTGLLTNPPKLPPEGVPIGRNLIVDPSLEETPTGELPTGWFAWLDDGPDFKCEVVEGGVTGKHCLQISGTGTRGVVFATSIPLDRTKRYALKGRLKVEGEAGTWAVIKLNYFNNSGWLGVDDRVGVTSSDFDWKLLEKTDRAENYPAATLLVPTCHIEGNGTAWFDDLEVIAYDRDKLPENFDVTHGKNNRMK
jgi:uncharacterized protein (TIGR03067 family)